MEFALLDRFFPLSLSFCSFSIAFITICPISSPFGSLSISPQQSPSILKLQKKSLHTRNLLSSAYSYRQDKENFARNLPVSAKNRTFAVQIKPILADSGKMETISSSIFAQKYGLSDRTVRNYCRQGKIAGAFLTGKTWNIPADAVPPHFGHAKRLSPLLQALTKQRQSKMKNGIYHRVQIDLTYNSNHIEGSKLTHDQTRMIFETHTLVSPPNVAVRVDDIVETINHFRCVDYIIDHATDPLTEGIIKQLHAILKSRTADSEKDWFAVGEYKKLPNEVGGKETSLPQNVAADMQALLKNYRQQKTKTEESIVDFHWQFESIHPFQDGNGRVGRLIMFKECLANNLVPFIIDEDLRYFYYRGLNQWPHVKGYLLDTCLAAQDKFRALLDYFQIKY